MTLERSSKEFLQSPQYFWASCCMLLLTCVPVELPSSPLLVAPCSLILTKSNCVCTKYLIKMLSCLVACLLPSFLFSHSPLSSILLFFFYSLCFLSFLPLSIPTFFPSCLPFHKLHNRQQFNRKNYQLLQVLNHVNFTQAYFTSSKCIGTSVMLYGSETWAVTRRM